MNTTTEIHLKKWLVKHLEGFYGERGQWTQDQIDKYHELLGFLYDYETERPEPP